MSKECYQAKKEWEKHFCQITGYVCPFKGEYHILEDKNGTESILNVGHREGCEVCYAYNLGLEDERFKHVKIENPIKNN